MGKQSKRQRTVNRKLREELEQAKAHTESVAAFHGRVLAKMTERAEYAELKLTRWHRDVAEFCASSTLLPLEKKLRYVNPHMRMMPQGDPYEMRRAIHESEMSFKAMHTEELMMILQDSPELRQDMARRMHFRVTNVPGQRGDFAYGYAVSQTEVDSCRTNRVRFVTMIAEQVARGIWSEIFGDKK